MNNPPDESSDEPIGAPDLPRVLAEALAKSTVALVQRRATELGILGLESANAGISISVFQAVKDRKNLENPNVAAVVLLAGPIPDDLVEMLQSYLKGLVQDYTSGNRSLQILGHSEHKDEDYDLGQ